MSIVTAVLFAVCCPAADTASEDELRAVQQFLARLGLAELQVLHLERVLERPLPDERRIELARRLADLYAGLLMSHSQDAKKAKQMRARVDSLIQRFPEANTPSLGVLLLQADYNRAEAEVTRWIRRPQDLQARDNARSILARVVARLDTHRKQLEDLIAQAWEQVEQIEEEQVRAAKEEEASRLEGVAAGAAFLAGWANYYAALVSEDPGKAKGQLTTARQCFRSVLDLTEDDRLEEIAADWFDLEAVWQCRALIGLGMAEAAAGELGGSRACFGVLQDPDAPPTIRDEAAYWHVQGLVNAGELEEARYLVEEQMGDWSAAATPGKVGACTALIAAGFGVKGRADAEVARATGMVGIAGLVRLGQFKTLRQLMAQYAIDPGQTGGLLLGGLKGRELFDRAEVSKSPEDYRAAKELLTAALADPEAKNDVAFAGQCRYTLARCHHRLGEYQEAAELFEQTAERLKTIDQATAAQAAWHAADSYYRLASKNDRYIASAVRVLNAIKRDFPKHPLTQKVDYYLAKIRRYSSSPAEMIEGLRRVRPGSPDFLTSRYEICLLEHQRWREAGDTAERSAIAVEVYQAVEAYLAAAGDDAEPAEKLRCLLLAAEVALSASRVDVKRVRSYLGRATALANARPASDSLAANYHYRTFELAGKTGDDRARREHADWLTRHAAGSAYELPALVVLAKEADARVASAGGASLSSLREKAAAIYARLVEHLGDSPEAISSQTNALVANSKLAGYLAEMGRHAEAAQRLEKILAARPDDKGYLRRAGLAHFQAGNYEKSLPHWRKLLAGLPRASESWYEAKYYQLGCLMRLDKARARQVVAQFELLHPGFGPEPWRGKLQEIRQALAGQ